MPKILFIAAHRPNRSPSQRYRFEQYFDFLRSQGYSCELSYIINEQDDAVFYGPGNILKKIGITLKSAQTRLKDVARSNEFDIIFVQREAFMTGSSYFEKKFSQSKAKLVFDFDDSIWLLDTSNANKIWQWMKSAKKTGEIIAVSDLVFAGNEFLADYARQFNSHVTVIPTTIDTQLFKRTKPYMDNEKICIGWSGSHTTIKHFESGIPFLKRIEEKYGDKVYFKVMGDTAYEHTELGIKGIPWSSETEVEVLSSFDIGIMPLPDDQWVKGKCGLKGLSYMALEVPTVMSAVGVNVKIIQDGKNGFLAGTEDEWVEKISRLIDSFELRKKMGSLARQTVETKYSHESQKNNYLKHFNALLMDKKSTFAEQKITP
ncbi:MAG TPA: glycosyltransferase family 4 protein [Bacteroidia bacterium]|jgi:glycosyltransferase involved in cell wall biosynthesis|nr:glycosyltransferase family 4 protein [Bacteroidia bacterium]